jgi:hypothetical protein
MPFYSRDEIVPHARPENLNNSADIPLEEICLTPTQVGHGGSAQIFVQYKLHIPFVDRCS